jgi:hypothetical protein
LETGEEEFEDLLEEGELLEGLDFVIGFCFEGGVLD